MTAFNSMRRAPTGGVLFLAWVLLQSVRSQAEEVCLVHDAHPSNSTSAHVTVIDHPALNGHPELKLFATAGASYLCAPLPGCPTNSAPFGVWYNDVLEQWTVFNEDFSPMEAGRQFHIHASSTNATVFSQVTVPGNLMMRGAYMELDHPLLNDNPDALLFITHDWTVGETYLPNHTAAAYLSNRWVIAAFGGPLPPGVNFNIMVQQPGAAVFVHEVTAGNLNGSSTVLHHPLLTDHPETRIMVAQNVALDIPVAHTHLELIYNPFAGVWTMGALDDTALAVSNRFNIRICPADCTPDKPRIFRHVTAPDNVSGRHTLLDHPELNGLSTGSLAVTPDRSGGAAPLSGPVGISMSGGSWRIHNENGQDMPAGVHFNVLFDTNPFTSLTANAPPTNQAFTLDHLRLTGNSNVLVFVTHDGSVAPATLDSPLATLRGPVLSQWGVFRQEALLSKPIPEGTRIHAVLRTPGEHGMEYVTSAASIAGNRGVIDHSLLNGNPRLRIVASRQFRFADPLVDTNYIGHVSVRYDADAERWGLARDDGQPMPPNVSFFLAWCDPGPHRFMHSATTLNTAANVTALDHPALNGNPQALVFIAHVWEPGDAVITSPVGIAYDTTQSQWTIYTESGAALPVGTDFAVGYAELTSDRIYRQTTAPGNIEFNRMRLRHPQLTGRPGRSVFVSRIKASGEPQFLHHIGVWYDGADWTLYTQDFALMPTNISFHVYIGGANDVLHTHVTGTGNTTNHITYLDHPALNDHPEAGLLFVQDFAASGPYQNRAFGLWYSEAARRWTIFAEDLAALPTDLRFRLLIFPADRDGDGMLDRHEIRAGTNPFNAASRMAIEITMWSRETISLTWSTVSYRCYILESSPTLLMPDWQPIGRMIGDGIATTHTQPALTATNSVGYYRIRLDRRNDQ